MKSFLDRIPPFSTLLVMVILTVAGICLVPLLDVAEKPRPQQGKTLRVTFSWPNTSPRVVEQEVTSKIEGLLSSVNGVEEVSSVSNLGNGSVSLTLKEDANVSAVRFEISSLLKQIAGKLPEDVSYPQLSGGDVVNEGAGEREESYQLLSYRINADMDGPQIKEYMEQNVVPVLMAHEEVTDVTVKGGRSKYVEILYDPALLSNYGLNGSTIASGIKTFMGQQGIVGDLVEEDAATGERQRITLHFSTAPFKGDIGSIPLTEVNGKRIYLNDLATYTYKDRLPSSYYRVNGLTSVYMNIDVDASANSIRMSKVLREEIDRLKPNLRNGVYLTLTDDASLETQTEIEKLVKRTALSLLILLLFVWWVSRSGRYLFIIAVTLVANLSLSVLVYYLCDIRLHIFALAGITVSLGLIIDSSIVMVDHYSYYHDRKAFLAILAALLTTIGSLVVIFFMPDYIQRDLYDFSRIIIINLTTALVVALLFVPALVQQMHYDSHSTSTQHRWSRFTIRWTAFYRRYITFTQRRKWIYIVFLIMAFGIPFHALPDRLDNGRKVYYMTQQEELPWYKEAYNATFGSPFFHSHLKEPLTKIFGGSMHLFAKKLKKNTFAEKERHVELYIRAKMPLGGSVHQLNEKVVKIEQLLARYDEIKRFETKVSSGGANITVEFKPEYEFGSFPYYLESMVIGEALTIGGADWSTSGVSERGFSNSLNLGYRNDRIEMTGYNYLRLYKYAEEISAALGKNRRVKDLIIENVSGKAVDELYMEFDHERLALYDVKPRSIYQSLRELLSEQDLGRYESDMMKTDLVLRSSQMDLFDLWHLRNAHVKVDGRDLPVSAFGHISERSVRNSIPKKNQSYTLTVAFNYIGSYESRTRFVDGLIDKFNDEVLPVGYHCDNRSYGYYKDTGTQYWLILLIVVIIFFLCSILFESLTLPLVIISIIPVSFIGTFLTFSITGVEFGTGGFASLVLLAGIVVNAGIYIVSEYRNSSNITTNKIVRYVRAYNHKIVPVFLTVFSTILGLIPFFIDTTTADFWLSFAVGTIGGLLFSLLAIIFVMPIFMPLRESLASRTNSL